MKFISICIPSFNRPQELLRLLNSIPEEVYAEIEIVICEDNSPKRLEIRDVVDDFKSTSKFEVNYVENSINLGYDANIRNLIVTAKGEYVVFMGDDDVFVNEGLPKFISFLKHNSQLGYILKTHYLIHHSGRKEIFKYYPTTKFFEPGESTMNQLFRKSVLISGFCIKREFVSDVHTDAFDGTLLYQLYLLAEVTLNHPSAFCDIPLTLQDENLRGKPLFGSSDSEKSLFTPGTITIENSVNFVKAFFKITNYIDAKYGTNSSEALKIDFSKYSYPLLSIQRHKGVKEFRRYFNLLKAIKINKTVHFYIYYYSLLLFGKNACDTIIMKLKTILGSTPRL